MGQYYLFVNKTRNEVSQISLPFNFGLSHAKSLERYAANEVAAMFRFVVQHNADWNEHDNLIAIGDYGEEITFAKEHLTEDKFNWESYQPEPRPPAKIKPGEKIW